MKSYLARLVARARPITPPESGATRGSPAGDPFVPGQPELPPSVAAPPSAPPAPTAASARTSLSPDPGRAPSPLQFKRPPLETPIPHFPLSPSAEKPPPPRPPADNAASSAPAPAAVAVARSEGRQSADPNVPVPPTIGPPTGIPLTVLDRGRSDFPSPPARPSPAAPPVRPARTHPSPVEDQEALLDLADRFMAGFAEHPAATAAAPPDEPLVHATAIGANRPLESSGSFPRTTPPPPALAPTIPSVVIGQLSVEVIGPSPSSGVPASPPRPIMRSRAIRRPIPAPSSSARFGLGQL
jgi:hypothetical protein